MNIYRVNLTKFFIYQSAWILMLQVFEFYLQKFEKKFVVKNTQFSKQNRRKQIWAKMKSKRCKIIEKKCSCCLR